MEKDITTSQVLASFLALYGLHSAFLLLSSVPPGRPNIPLVLVDVTRGMGRYDRVGVGVCGPLEMLRDTRMAELGWYHII
jgi:hypothetical protein